MNFTSTITLGYRDLAIWRINGNMGDMDGIAPKRKRPCKSPCIASTSSRIASQWDIMSLAHLVTRSPSAVRPCRRCPRPLRKIGTPSSSSSCLMPLERLGWVALHLEAALPKCPSSTTASKYLSCLKYIVSLLPFQRVAEARSEEQYDVARNRQRSICAIGSALPGV